MSACVCQRSDKNSLSTAELRKYGEGCTAGKHVAGTAFAFTGPGYICPELDRLRRAATKRDDARERITKMKESKK